MLGLMLTIAATAAVAEAVDDPLTQHQWRHRVLLLFAPDAEQAALQRFSERVVERQCGIDARDLVTGTIVADWRGRLAGQAISERGIDTLRSRYDVPTDRVATVLIGKDGGAKMAVDGVADMDAVFERIDGMPMRQREMRNREDPGCD